MTLPENLLGHGMGAEWEQKDWAHISQNDLSELQVYFSQLHGQIEIIWRSPRPFSSAVLVKVVVAQPSMTKDHTPNTDSYIYFIKRSHRSFRNAFDLLQEHACIQHLAHKGLPVVSLVKATTGKTAIELGEWTYEVHEQAAGFDIYADLQSWKPFFYPQHAEKAGTLLAQLHTAMQDYPYLQGRSARYLVSNQALLESDNIADAIQERIIQSKALSHYFQHRALDADFLAQVVQIHQTIQQPLKRSKKIWTHNDLHASNLLWSTHSAQADISAVFDFGLSDYNCAAYDLAVAIERNFIDWLALEHTEEILIDRQGLSAFLQAYFSAQTSQEDFSFVPELLKIVHLDFAFSELEYFVEITQNLAHADAAYENWLIGHTRWFLSEQGQKLTQDLMQWMK